MTQRATKELLSELDDLFIDANPVVARQFPIHEIADSEKGAGAFGKKIGELTYKYSGGYIMLLIGGIGAGKSTFLYRYFKILLKGTKDVVYFITDFRKAAIDTCNIEPFIFQTILDIWSIDYADKHDEFSEINKRLDTATDLKAKLKSLIDDLHALKKNIVLVIDNVDQQPREYQEKLFLVSNSIMDTFKIIVIVSLREETFMQSMRIGVFDAFNIPKFHIPSPNMLSMLRKRIEVTLSILDKECQETLSNSSIVKYEEEIRVKLEMYFKILLGSLDKSNTQSKAIIRILDNVSCGNMRLALEMFRDFVQSGNTDIQTIFNVVETNEFRLYQISAHQMIKSIMLGDNRYFYDSRSIVLNVFDFDTTISDSHMNSLRILRYLHERENRKSAFQIRGFIDINEILNAADDVLISKDVVCSSIGRLVEYGLAELDTLSKTDLQNASYVKITITGKFYLRYLVHELIYFDLISVSTPISDSNLFRYLIRKITNVDLRNRNQKARMFVDYLKAAEDEEHTLHPEYAYYEFTSYRFMPLIQKHIIKQIDNINDRQRTRYYNY